MHFYIFCLIVSLYKISEAFYSFQCPVQAHWKHRSETSCDSGDSYFCLYDQNKNTFTEFCREYPDFEAPGQKLIVAGSFKGTLQGADCDNDFYQPFQFLSSGNSRCAYKKSYCSGEGQVILSNGTMKEDRLCRCDYTRGYDFIVRPKHQCYCVPTKEDCSCYLKLCSANDILSPDYECLHKNKWKTSFKCDQLVNVLLPDESGIPSTIITWFGTYVPVIYDFEKYRKEALIAVLLAISSIIITILVMLVIWILPLKSLSCRLKHESTVIDKMPMRNINNTNMDKVTNDVAYDKNKFEIKIDTITMIKEGAVGKLDKNTVNISLYIQEFQNKTQRDWSSKLEKFVITRAAEVIYNHILTKNVILITGPTGVGKSINAYYVAFELQKKYDYTIIPARQPVDIINHHVTGTKQIFIIDDFIGKYAVDETDAALWEKNGLLLNMIFSHNDQTKLILTTRSYIWKLEGYNHFSIPSYTCDLLSEELTLLPSERWNIYKSYISTVDAKPLNEEDIMMYSFFPSLCPMYTFSKTISVHRFFTVPYQIFENEIKNFKTKSQVRFIALAILAIRQNIGKNSLTIDNHQHDELLQDLFHESSFLQYPSKSLLKSTLSAFGGEYVRVSFAGCFEFIHSTMQNIVLCCIAKTFIKSVIKYCKTDVILNQVRLDCINIDEKQDALTIKVTRENENAYFKRLVFELSQGLHKDVFENAQNQYPQFRKKILQCIKLYHTRENFTRTQDGMTALHVVSALGYQDYVSFFIHNKHMINISDTDGNIPLHLACRNGHLTIVEDLVNNKSSIDIANNEGLEPFFYACENGFTKVAKYLLHYSAKWIKVNEKYRTKNMRGLLHIVCGNGFTNLAMLLIKKNAEVNGKDADGCTPLHLACYNGNSGTVSALLNSKANVDAVNSFGKTAVYFACSGNHDRVLKLLLERKAVVNQKIKNGMTPIRVSCKNKNIDIVKMLLQNGAKVNNHGPNVVPLHEASKAGNESIINILIQARASVNHKTKEGITPLHEACINGYDNVVKILLDNNAVVNDKDKHGWTALFFSSVNGFHTIVKLLLQKGANPNSSDEDNINPLLLACKENHRDVVELLLQSKSDVNQCDKDNCSSLAFACKTGNADVVNLLLKYCAEINLADKEMISPLHTACMYNNTNIVLILINNKANINAIDKLGQTPLFKSSLNGYTEIVEVLLHHGASIDICDKGGISPMAIANKNEHTQVVEVFKQYKRTSKLV